MGHQQQRLHLEHLEDRLTPATFGFPWPNASHLTVSFVPDGTLVGNAPSQLGSTLLAQGIQPSVWQGEVLRALQTWAANANINFSVVADDGSPLGTPGALQGDSRFGDIRIAGAPLSSGVVTTQTLSSESVSMSVPFDPTTGTWAGDLLFNTNFTFGIGSSPTFDPSTYDIYSLALHEAGHILGLAGNLTDSSSVLFEYYNGVRTGLSASDITAEQQLYGTRRPDRFDRATGNDSLATATNFRQAALHQYQRDLRTFEQASDITGVLPFSVAADLTTASDVDVFTYRTTQQQPNFTVNLFTSDLSLLQARLTVFDDEGHIVATTVASDPLQGNLTLHINNAVAHDRYFIKVEAAQSNVFGIGAYRLQVVPDNPDAQNRLNQVLQSFQQQLHTNDTLDTATHLKRAAQSTPDHKDFYTEGTLSSSSDVDYYRLRAPASSTGPVSLTVLVWMKTSGGIVPAVTVYDAQGNAVSADVLINADGTEVVRVAAAQPRAIYYVAVRSASYPASATTMDGLYSLAAEFGAPTTIAPVVASGAVSGIFGDTTQQDFRSVVLEQSQVLDLTITAGTPNTSAETELEVTLYDQSGHVVFDQILKPGQTLQKTLFLPKGGYTFRFVGGTRDQSPLPSMSYVVTGVALSEPIGPKLINPDQPPPPRDVQPTWLLNGLLEILSPYDPFGNLYNGLPNT
jgi:hypothetical protein